MFRFSKLRGPLSVGLSAGIHAGLVMAMLAIPRHLAKTYETVDLAVERTSEPDPEPPPDIEEAPEPEPEPTKPKIKKAVAPKEIVEEEPPPPPEPEENKELEEAPPVFDLGDNTFATADGQGSDWTLNRSEGNTKLAAVAGKKRPSVRNTRPAGATDGTRGGTGKPTDLRPVPFKDLSKRPEPKDGAVPIPPYPLEARRADIEGPVIMQVFLDRNGRVKKMKIIKSPAEVLAEAAKRTMANVLWTPALDKIGNPVDTVFVYTFRFVLDG